MPETLPPILKWAGGKRWLIPRLQKLYDRDRRLLDLFAGGLSVTLGLNPERAIVNDINEHVINLYWQIRNGLTVDCELLNDRDFYYAAREEFNQRTIADRQWSKRSAILFYYLNRTGFNGLCRFNLKGGYNVPFGKYKTINYQQDFLRYREVMSRWRFINGDFEDVVVWPDYFIYADPPYDTEFTAYSHGGFTWDDQERLAHWLAKQDCPVVASNQATPRILELYSDLGFAIEVIDAPRSISCKGDRAPAQEMLATRNTSRLNFAELMPNKAKDNGIKP